MTSVVVPVLNGAEILSRTVPAVLALDGVDEWVWVDDGSTDGTGETLTSLTSGADAARVVRLGENRGRGAARNAGVEATRGDRLVFFDADVEPPPEAAARLRDALDRPGVVASVAQVRSILDRPEDPYQRYLADHPRGPAPGTGPVRWRFFLTCACALRRSAFTEAGGFDASIAYGEDFELACRLSKRSPEGLHVADTTVAIHEVAHLDTALANMHTFGHALRSIGRRHPEAIALAGLPRAAVALARWPVVPSPQTVSRVVRSLPPALHPRAVRVGLGLSLLHGLGRA
ncbi:MAG: glycosyltransferase [Bacteroidota bacterium]